MKEKVTLNREEHSFRLVVRVKKRLVVLNQVDAGRMIGREVAEVLGLSLRQVRRILAAYRKEGAAALAHANRGRKPHIDDATGKVPYALFRHEEDAQGYFLLLRQIVASQGVPMALYHDGHGILERSKRAPESLEEQLEGRRRPTQFGRLMEELGITSMKEANRVSWDFLPRYSPKFAIPATEPGSAYRQPEEAFNPDEVFCFKYYRTVGPDNVVRFGEHRLQILPTNGRLSYARSRVELHERLEGSLAVYYQGHCLVTKPTPQEAPVLRVRNIARVIPDMADSNELPVSFIAAKKTL